MTKKKRTGKKSTDQALRSSSTMVLLFGALFLVILESCAPSVRYTRSSSPVITSTQYLVPRNWDYRTSYKVPPGRLTTVISGWLGAPYRFGGMSRKGVDCSGFVCQVYREFNHAKLPHSSRKLRKYGKPVSRANARAGDLVFFRGGVFNSVNHVGIFIEGDRFAHASTKRGVIYSSLTDTYYRERFVEIRRIF